MIVHIVSDGASVSAMGHRVALHLGGEPELKRRVLHTLAQLDAPPDEVRFRRLAAGDVEAEGPAEPPAPPAPPSEAAERPEEPDPEPPPLPRGKPPPRRKGKA